MRLLQRSRTILLALSAMFLGVPCGIAQRVAPDVRQAPHADADARLPALAQTVYSLNDSDSVAAAEPRDAGQRQANKVEQLRRAAKYLEAAGKKVLARQLVQEALLEEKLEQLRGLQAEIDKLRAATATDRAVTLHMKIMELNVAKMRKLGLDFQLSGGIVFDQLPGDAPTKAGLFGGLLSALQANELVQVLAESTLVTVSGRPASVQSGGEFPIVVPQGDGEFAVEYRQFGTRVDCVAEVRANGRIRLELRPSVSEIDVSRSVVLGDMSVPGLRTRWVDTAVEMEAGQTLLLSGIAQSRPEVAGDAAEPEETALLVSITANLDQGVMQAELQRASDRR